MKFNRYVSLENHYQARYIEKWVGYNPDLRTCEYVATEKLHGSNFSIWVVDGELSYGRRKGFIDSDIKFYRYQEALAEPELIEFLKPFQDMSKTPGHNIVFYGELFGQGVQDEVKYQSNQRFRVFDVLRLSEDNEDKWLSPQEVYDLVPEHLRVPHIKIVKSGIQDALALSNVFPSTLNPIEGNICEGIVIRPWNKNYIDPNTGSMFIIKSKNKNFSEKSKPAKKLKEVDPVVQDALNVAVAFVTPQRLSNVISHIGEPEGMKQFGIYNKAFVEDVRTDVLKEHPEFNELDKTQMKALWKRVSSECSNVLRARLMQV